MLFRGELEAALRRFNPSMADDASRSTIERQGYDEAEQRHRAVRLIDFDTPSANALHVTWEWTAKPPARQRNRADVMFVANGVPVAIVEHKKPTDRDAIERGITQLRRYEQQTPELIAAAQLFNVTHLLDYWYGVTWNASRRFMPGFQDFVIAHELLHLRVANHGRLFKSLMTAHVPDWKRYDAVRRRSPGAS